MENNNNYPGQAHEEVTQRVVYKHVMAIAPILFGMMLLSIFAVIAIIYVNTNLASVETFIPPIFLTLIGFVFIAVIVM